jgi:secreted trypsin-like serine protease
MKLKLVLMIFLFSICDLSHALYGARPLLKGQHEAVVSLHLNDPFNPEYDYFCNGVVIAADTILTAGHCIEGMATEVYEKWFIFSYEPQLIKVKVAGVKYEVADVALSPGYAEQAGLAGEDLAIIKLKKTVSIAPLKLAKRSDVKTGMPVSLIAHGKIADSILNGIKVLGGNTVIFSAGSRVGVCQGDSGGALVIRKNGENLLAGILSVQNPGCEKQDSSSVFPKTSF